MNNSQYYNLNMPERAEQFNLDHWNQNTQIIDTELNRNAVNNQQNANDIATLFAGLNTVNVSDTNSVFYKLFKLIYPVGSIYWSSNSTNPATLFGGTWSRIKDKFILACGDTYPLNATGGNANTTLSESNLPSHRHSFTPSGTVSSHSHSISISGSTSTNNGLGIKINETGTQETRNVFIYGSGDTSNYSSGQPIPYYSGSKIDHGGITNHISNQVKSESHSHSVSISGNSNPTQPTFSGSLGNTSHVGSGTPFSNMPPYLVKYCWERIS